MPLTDDTGGRAVSHERTAFLDDKRKAKPPGLACEPVIPPERDNIGQPRVVPDHAGSPVIDTRTSGRASLPGIGDNSAPT